MLLFCCANKGQATWFGLAWLPAVCKNVSFFSSSGCLAVSIFFVCRCFGVTKSLSHQLKRSWSYRGGHKWSLKTYFALLANLGFCSKYLCKILVSKLICSYSFVHACKFLNVLAFSVLNEGNFWQVLVASKASSCQYSCS